MRFMSEEKIKPLARQWRLPSAPASGHDLLKRIIVPVGQVPVRELRRYLSRLLCAVIAACGRDAGPPH